MQSCGRYRAAALVCEPCSMWVHGRRHQAAPSTGGQMIRTGIVTTALVTGLLSCVVAATHATPGAVQAAAQATAADAVPFLGEWTLNLEGPNGPAVFDLTLKVDADKVVGEMK